MKLKKPSRRLLKVLDLMRTHPEAINMYNWRGYLGYVNEFGFGILLSSLKRKSSPRESEFKSQCGTPGCIAGWSAYLFPVAFNNAIPKTLSEGVRLKSYNVSRVAAKILGIPEDAMVPSRWPEELQEKYSDADQKEKYYVICKVLRYYGIDV